MNIDTLNITEETYAAGEEALAGYLQIHEVDRLDVASDVLHAALPLDRITELQRLVDRFEVVRSSMREEDGRSLRSSAIGVAIGIIQERITELRGSV